MLLLPGITKSRTGYWQVLRTTQLARTVATLPSIGTRGDLFQPLNPERRLMRPESEAMEAVYSILRTFTRADLVALVKDAHSCWLVDGFLPYPTSAVPLLIYQILFTIEKKDNGQW